MMSYKFIFPDEELLLDKSPIPVMSGVKAIHRDQLYYISNVIYNLDTDTVEVYFSPRSDYFSKLPHLRL